MGWRAIWMQGCFSILSCSILLYRFASLVTQIESASTCINVSIRMDKFTHPLTESQFCSLTLQVWRHQSLVTPCRGNAGLKPPNWKCPTIPIGSHWLVWHHDMTHVIGHHDMTHLSTSARHLVMSAQLGVPIPQSTLGMTRSGQLKKLRFGNELRKSCKCCNEANNVKMVACHCGFLNSALLPQFQWGSLHKDYVGPSYLYYKLCLSILLNFTIQGF